MNNGFTTGSCAAAAAKAAAYMLLGGNRIDKIKIDTPAGVEYNADIEDINIGEEAVSCAVRKYSGDDPDITNNILVYARVEIHEHSNTPSCTNIIGSAPKETEHHNKAYDHCTANVTSALPIRYDNSTDNTLGQPSQGFSIDTSDSTGRIIIEGSEGVGIVTRPGLDQPVGNAAINSVPRSMITNEVSQVMELFDYTGALKITIYVPDGRELAGKTFNPRLGIEGGISIIGTSGIVEPMSTRALLETIRLELNQRRVEGAEAVVISPGNYGLTFMQEHYGYDLNRAVKCSNYIGDTIDMAVAMGYSRLLLTGHIGKLIKVSGGIMNTHSREGDCRMELMAAAAIRSGASSGTLNKILDSASTEEACGYLIDAGINKECMSYIMDKIMHHLDKRANGKLEIRCIMYSSKWGLLGCSPGAEDMLRGMM